MRSSNQLNITTDLETACVFIMSCLKEFAGDDMNAAERACQSTPADGVLIKTGMAPVLDSVPESVNDLLHFDKLLILGMKEDAIAFGEHLISKRYADKGISLNLPACYEASSKQRAEELSLLKSQLNNVELAHDAAKKLSDYLVAFAEADARKLLQSLISDLPKMIFVIMKKLMGELFFKSLHFGADDTIAMLLSAQMDVNLLDTNHPCGAFHPLHLVLLDFARFTANIDNIFDETDEVELDNLIDKRIKSYHSIVGMLLKAGANVDAEPGSNKQMQGVMSPRKLSLQLHEIITQDIADLPNDTDTTLKKTIKQKYLNFLSTNNAYVDKKATLSASQFVMYPAKTEATPERPRLIHYHGYI